MQFQISSIVVLLVFYGCYFGKMFSQRKKGIQTDQIGKGKEGLVKGIELTMKAATIAVPVGELVSVCLNISELPVWARYTGLMLAVLGVLIFISSVVTMRDSWRAGVSETDRTELVTTGIYQVSRNPAFLGFDLVYAGIVLMFFSWGLFILSVFAALMFHLQIVNVEEEFLLKSFGEEYLNYRKKVRRYLGRRGGLVSKIIRCLLLLLLAAVLVILAAHAIGGMFNRRTPDGGINESMYVDINGTKQWINIYGEDTDNPLLLYLHGGPGSSTSDIDYAFTRKWADVYTVVTWDQRNCGKSYDAIQNDTKLTRDLLMEDGKQITEYLLDYMGKEKLTLLGHSWGSFYGANLAQAYPEYYECFIGTGQLVDMVENETAFKEEAAVWAADDEQAMSLVNQLTPDNFTLDHIKIRNTLMEKYGYGLMVDGSDYNLITTILFNPHYSLIDWMKYFQRDSSVYFEFFNSEELRSFSLKDKYEYQVPYYNINGDKDYQTNYKLAQEYFDQVKAPYKEMFIMKDTTHGLLESKSEEFSEIVHEIAENSGDN